LHLDTPVQGGQIPFEEERPRKQCRSTGLTGVGSTSSSCREEAESLIDPKATTGLPTFKAEGETTGKLGDAFLHNNSRLYSHGTTKSRPKGLPPCATGQALLIRQARWLPLDKQTRPLEGRRLLASLLHATGFEPALPFRGTDYESVAFDHSAMHATAILPIMVPRCKEVFISQPLLRCLGAALSSSLSRPDGLFPRLIPPCGAYLATRSPARRPLSSQALARPTSLGPCDR
jgi:hypothetical protein